MSEAPTGLQFSSEYARLTDKYKEALGLEDNQIVAKSWSSSLSGNKAKMQERKRLWALGGKKLSVIQSLYPFKRANIANLSAEQLHSLYVVQEMIDTDVASGLFETIALKDELKGIKTVPYKGTGVDNPPAYVTIVTFYPDSKVFSKISAAGEQQTS